MLESFAEAVDRVAHESTNERGQRMSVGEIAERIGRPENYLRKAVSQYDDAHPLRGDLIVPLTRATENYAIVEHIAEACGGVFFRLPDVHHGASRDVIGQTGRMATEFGDVLKQLTDALADGTVTEEEALIVERESLELVAETMRMVRLIKAKAGVFEPPRQES